jgi:hypothetical protein
LVFKDRGKARVAAIIRDPKRRDLGLDLHVVLELIKANRELLNTGYELPEHSLALRPDSARTINRLCDQIQLEAWGCELQGEFNLVKHAIFVRWVVATVQSCFVCFVKTGDWGLRLRIQINIVKIFV